MAISINHAFYGTAHNGSADVTSQVQTMVARGSDDVYVNNEAMGGDPAPGVQKQFGVLYYLEDGTFLAKTGVEGETIDLV